MPRIGIADLREHLDDRGVYLGVFEQSVLASQKSNRPLGFFASISAELLVISALIIVPLTYNNHLPDFHWQSIGVGTPLKPVRAVPQRVLRRASSGISVPRLFTGFPIAQSQHAGGETAAVESWGPPGIDLSPDLAGPESSRVIDISGHVANMPGPPLVREPEPQKQAQGPMRVSGGVQMAKLMKKVIPEYPTLAKSARVSGVVHLIGIIGRDGTIRNLELVSGHPLLARAAFQAVQQWIYKPTLLNGEPVEVIAPIDVYFNLGP